MRTYQGLAYTIAIKITGNREDAEEVVQDAMLKAFSAMSDFRRAAKFSTWLYRIVYNTALTKVGGRKPKPMDIDEYPEDNLLTNNEIREWNLLIAADRKKYVGLALDQLKPDERLIITLHYIAEKSISEVCEIMQLKKSAVKMRLLRGRKQLEDALKHLLADELTTLL